MDRLLQGTPGPELSGVELVISDHHLGLKSAIEAVFIGAAWQRCRVHFMRNVLAKVPRASAEMVAAAIRTIFAQPDAAHVRAQLDEITTMLAGQFPDVATMLADARRGPLGLRRLPPGPLAQAVVHQPPGPRQRRDQTALQRGGYLPQRRLRRPPGHRRGRRDPRTNRAIAERRYLSEESMAQIRHPDVSILAVEAPKVASAHCLTD